MDTPRVCAFVSLFLVSGASDVASTTGAAVPGDAVVPADRGTTRLIAELGTAQIESPLTGLEAAHDIGDLADPALDLLVLESFEDFEWEYSGWPRAAGVDVVDDGGNRVLQLDTFPDGASIGWVLPVRPDAFYRFQRAVKVKGEPFCDLYIVESTLEPEDALPNEDHFLAGRGAALKVHGLPLEPGPLGEEAPSEWQRGSTTFYPTPRTRSLVIGIRPRTGADPGTTVRRMSFDDVQLEEVVASRKERMRLLKGAHAVTDEQVVDPALGMVKSGWLLPLPSPRGVRDGEPAETNYTWRRALYAPPTTEIVFDVALPAATQLRLATGLARETPPGAEARFQVEVHTDGAEPERLLDVVRAARMTEWHWEDVDVDLSRWAGSEVSLVLRTVAEKGDAHPLWANPRLEVLPEPVAIDEGASTEAPAEKDPLLILIAVDTLRADRLSAYGYERPTTPALDRLAEEGVRFDQARSNCNWTCPSFASIFTGLVPSRHGVSSYGPATPLPDELVTLAEHLRDEGWATHSIAYKVPLFDGNYEQGFDRAFNVPRDFIRGEENLKHALAWLDEHRGGPSFLFLHFNDPHQPFVQPEPYDRKYGPDPESLGHGDVPRSSQIADEEGREMFANLYDGAVSYVDSCIGQFLEALRERGLYDHASVVFVADHGEQLWEHGRFGHGGDALYDEIVRVPLLVKPPTGTFEPGQVIEADVSGFDVMPTLLELAGVPPASELDALSLMPLVRGERESLGRVVVTETSQRGLALVDGGYKFVLEPGGYREALYDLKADPLERTDLAEERPEERARMRALAIAYIVEHRPGQYLLARTDTDGTLLRTSTPGLRTLVGHRAQDGAAELSAGIWNLFEVEDPTAAQVAVEGLELRAPEPAPFAAVAPAGLAALEGPGVWRIAGPVPVRAEETATEPEPIDEELLETLRALGYAE